MDVEPYYPEDTSWLRAVDQTVIGTPLLAVNPENWPGVRAALERYRAGDTLTGAASWDFGADRDTGGTPIAVLSISIQGTDAILRVALSSDEDRSVLEGIAARGQVAMTTPEVLDALPNDGEAREDFGREIWVCAVDGEAVRSFLEQVDAHAADSPD